MRLSAEEQTNFIPRSLGSMMLRPGWQYLLSSRSDAKAKYIPFVYSTTDTALLECTASFLRPLVSEAVITRASVSTTVTNGDFSAGAGWTIAATGGATGTIASGKLTMSCVPIDSYVTCTRSVTVAVGDQNVEHALRIVVDRGPVYFRCGSSSGGEQYIETTPLGTGTHSLTVTPTVGTIYVEFEGRTAREVIVDSITVEGSGTLTLPAFWAEADLPFLRWEQSGDVVFLACYGYRRYKIERRTTRSWSIVTYEEEDGPFLGYTTEPNVKMSINVARGNGTLTASRTFFKSTHVGALFRVFTPGYDFTYQLGKEDCFTPAVRINGVGSARSVSIVTTGTWVGTLTVQKSYTGEDSGFSDTSTTITTNTTTTVSDTADNTAVWVRVGFKTGAYTSGLAVVQLNFGTGSGGVVSQGSSSVATAIGGRTGVCRVLTVASNGLTATVDTFADFSSSQKSLDWFEAEWSTRRGYPTAVSLHEGRMFWGGKSIVGSVPDAYNSYDPSIEGDSGLIQRTIGFGPVQLVNWLLPMTRLMIGGEASEISVRSSSFDEPLTPTNFSLKPVSDYGSARVPGVKLDGRGIFVDRAKLRLLGIEFSVEKNDYITKDLSRFVPDMNLANPVVGIAIQRQPDTRFHCLREDGTVAMLIFEPLEEVLCWIEIETDGIVEDVVVLPGDEEDKVYYLVKRTINGSTKRYLERWAQESECVGGTLNKQADSFILYSGASTTTITGLSHLEGESVVVWGNGADLGTYTVSSSQITGLSSAVTSAVVGLPYTARFKSAKLAYAAQMGTSLGQIKKVGHVGLVLYKTHYQGVSHGYDFDHLEPLPLVKDGAAVAADTIYDHHDEPMNPQRGVWDADARLCLEASAPRPVTVLGVVISVNTSDKGA